MASGIVIVDNMDFQMLVRFRCYSFFSSFTAIHEGVLTQQTRDFLKTNISILQDETLTRVADTDQDGKCKCTNETHFYQHNIHRSSDNIVEGNISHNRTNTKILEDIVVKILNLLIVYIPRK